MIQKTNLHLAIRDRAFVGFTLVAVLLVAVIAVLSVLSIHVSDVQIPIRYNIFGAQGSFSIYRDKWHYLLTFPVMALVVSAVHFLIALRLLPGRRAIAIGVIALSGFILVITIRIMLAIFNLAGAPL